MRLSQNALSAVSERCSEQRMQPTRKTLSALTAALSRRRIELCVEALPQSPHKPYGWAKSDSYMDKLSERPQSPQRRFLEQEDVSPSAKPEAPQSDCEAA